MDAARRPLAHRLRSSSQASASSRIGCSAYLSTASTFGFARLPPRSPAVSLLMIQRQMLKYAACSSPVGSECASCGIFTSPDSIASVRPKSLTTHGKILFVSSPARAR